MCLLYVQHFKFLDGFPFLKWFCDTPWIFWIFFSRTRTSFDKVTEIQSYVEHSGILICDLVKYFSKLDWEVYHDSINNNVESQFNFEQYPEGF